LVRDLADLYYLKASQLSKLEGLAEKSAANLVAAIEKVKATRCTGFSLDSASALSGRRLPGCWQSIF